MTEFLLTMGPFLAPLLLLSVYTVGLILAKARDLRRTRPLGPVEFASWLDAVAGGADPGGLGPDHPLAVILAHRTEAPALRQARAQAALAVLEDRLGYLPALANVATLVGLFGTVCGMIAAFLSLRSGGGADPASLAGGLGQALAATALGLLSAIPALGAHAVFQKRVHGLATQMEALLGALLPPVGEPDRG